MKRDLDIVEQLDRIAKVHSKLSFLGDYFTHYRNDYCKQGIFLVIEDVLRDVEDIEAALSAKNEDIRL